MQSEQKFTPDPSVIYLAPECCFDRGSHEGRCWCEDNVWPCRDCPDPSKASATVYVRKGNATASPSTEETSDV